MSLFDSFIKRVAIDFGIINEELQEKDLGKQESDELKKYEQQDKFFQSITNQDGIDNSDNSNVDIIDEDENSADVAEISVVKNLINKLNALRASLIGQRLPRSEIVYSLKTIRNGVLSLNEANDSLKQSVSEKLDSLIDFYQTLSGDLSQYKPNLPENIYSLCFDFFTLYKYLEPKTYGLSDEKKSLEQDISDIDNVISDADNISDTDNAIYNVEESELFEDRLNRLNDRLDRLNTLNSVLPEKSKSLDSDYTNVFENIDKVKSEYDDYQESTRYDISDTDNAIYNVEDFNSNSKDSDKEEEKVWKQYNEKLNILNEKLNELGISSEIRKLKDLLHKIIVSYFNSISYYKPEHRVNFQYIYQNSENTIGYDYIDLIKQFEHTYNEIVHRISEKVGDDFEKFKESMRNEQSIQDTLESFISKVFSTALKSINPDNPDYLLSDTLHKFDELMKLFKKLKYSVSGNITKRVNQISELNISYDTLCSDNFIRKIIWENSRRNNLSTFETNELMKDQLAESLKIYFTLSFLSSLDNKNKDVVKSINELSSNLLKVANVSRAKDLNYDIIKDYINIYGISTVIQALQSNFATNSNIFREFNMLFYSFNSVNDIIKKEHNDIVGLSVGQLISNIIQVFNASYIRVLPIHELRTKIEGNVTQEIKTKLSPIINTLSNLCEFLNNSIPKCVKYLNNSDLVNSTIGNIMKKKPKIYEDLKTLVDKYIKYKSEIAAYNIKNIIKI